MKREAFCSSDLRYSELLDAVCIPSRSNHRIGRRKSIQHKEQLSNKSTSQWPDRSALELDFNLWILTKVNESLQLLAFYFDTFFRLSHSTGDLNCLERLKRGFAFTLHPKLTMKIYKNKTKYKHDHEHTKFSPFTRRQSQIVRFHWIPGSVRNHSWTFVPSAITRRVLLLR